MFNTNSKIFEENLMKLINNSGLKVSEAYYIVENAALQLKIVYQEILLKEKYETQEEQHSTSSEIDNTDFLNQLNNNKEIMENDDTVNQDDA